MMCSGREGGVREVALEELLDLGVPRLEELFLGPLLDDLPAGEEGQTIRYPEGAANVVGYHHAGHAELIVEALHQAVDHVRVDRIEPRGGLVIEQVLGAAR